MMNEPRCSERGSTIPLLIFFMFLGLALIGVTAAATSLLITHKRLLNLADGAALYATEQFATDSIERIGDALVVHLSDTDVDTATHSYLEAAQVDGDIAGLREVHVVFAESPDGRSARVRLTSQWEPPIISVLVPLSIDLSATSTARTVFR